MKILPCNGILLQKPPPVVLYILMDQGQHFFSCVLGEGGGWKESKKEYREHVP